MEPCSQPRLAVLTTLYSHSSFERITDRGLQPNCLKTLLPLPALQGFDFLAISTHVIHSGADAGLAEHCEGLISWPGAARTPMSSVAISRAKSCLAPTPWQHPKPRDRISRQRIRSEAGVTIRRACQEDGGAIRQSVQRER